MSVRGRVEKYLRFFAGGFGPADALAWRPARHTDLPTCDETRRGDEFRVEGGTGTADRKVRCEKDAANAYAWVEVGSAALDAAYQPLDADLTAIAALADPNADRGLFWDDSAGTWKHLTFGTGLAISDTTLNADVPGLVYLTSDTFSGSSAVTIDDVFGSYEAHRILIRLTAISNAAAQNLRLQVRDNGSNVTTANAYSFDRFGVTGGAANLQSDASEASMVWGTTGANATGLVATFDLFSLTITEATTLAGISTSTGGTPRAVAHGSYHSTGSAYDGINLFPDSGTMTGKYWVYGYRTS